MTVSLTLDAVSASYGSTRVLEDLSLHLAEGELVSLLGASGCGKTTTLRLVAGFLAPTSGTIRLGTRDLTRLPAHARDIGLVFQTYALFPHLTVLDNVAFGLKQRGQGRAARRAAAGEMIERVGLSGLADRHPANLSGGQRQRVALARALVIDPPLLMFDEPLSATSTPSCASTCGWRSAGCSARTAPPRSTSPTIRRRPSPSPTASRSWTPAASCSSTCRRCSTPAPPTPSSPISWASRTSSPCASVGDAGETLRAQMEGGTTLDLPRADYAIPPGRDLILAARADGLDGRARRPRHPRDGSVCAPIWAAPTSTAARPPLGEIIANGPLSDPREPGEAAVLIPNPEQCCLLSAAVP